MAPQTGSLSIKYEDSYYTLHFAHHGWMAADMVQYLDDLYDREDPRIGILKLLGYTMEIADKAPPRTADHWVEIDLEKKTLATNSDFLRKVVKKQDPDADDPYHRPAFNRIYSALDVRDFKVELFK